MMFIIGFDHTLVSNILTRSLYWNKLKEKLTLIKETLSITNNKPGALIVSKAEDTNPNVMAIVWGTIGYIWRKPIFTVLVRPSRYTYELINKSGEFTANIPYPSIKKVVMFWGYHNRRELDKFTKLVLTQLPSRSIKTPIILECAINWVQSYTL